ncbi:MAG: transcription elongation factor GreA [Acholeplasmataceae bacterium]
MATNTKPTYQLTQEGYDKLQAELKLLIEVKRDENLEALKEARAQGDLSENADYDAARTEQARIEGRIAEIENILKYAKIIKTNQDDVINIGKKVKLLFMDTKKEREFYFISSIEVDPLNNKISIESPIGKALKGHEKGDEVTYKSETNKITKVKILDVE